jgi:hypothetical protein
MQIESTDQTEVQEIFSSTAALGRFFIDGKWQILEIRCSTCKYGRIFDKRLDEPSNMGCKKPGWEGYTFDNNPACNSVFYLPNK